MRSWLGIARLATGRNTNVKLVEPPSCSSPSAIVFIGRNRRGQWVAQEQNGLYGGLFVSRAQAVKYALFENGHHPETIVELAREIELDMGANARRLPRRCCCRGASRSRPNRHPLQGEQDGFSFIPFRTGSRWSIP